MKQIFLLTAIQSFRAFLLLAKCLKYHTQIYSFGEKDSLLSDVDVIILTAMS